MDIIQADYTQLDTIAAPLPNMERRLSAHAAF